MTNTTRKAQPVDVAFSQDFAQRLIAGWNSHDPARLTELCHSDVLVGEPLHRRWTPHRPRGTD